MGEDNKVANILSRNVLDQLASVVMLISLNKFMAAQKTCSNVKRLLLSPALTCVMRCLQSPLQLHTKMSPGKPCIIVTAMLRE